MVQPRRRTLRDDGRPPDPTQADGDRDLEAGLPWSSSCWVQDLGRAPCVVDAAPSGGPAPGLAEATCLQPQMLEVRLPRDAAKAGGGLAVVEGPHGPVQVEPPAGARPGEKVQLRLGAPPEMRVQVPKDGKPGDPLQIIRADRVKICVSVPQGFKGGDFFCVAAPVLVVAVPEGAQPDEEVVFYEPAPAGKRRWLQARCPRELMYGRYFAACIPSASSLNRPER